MNVRCIKNSLLVALGYVVLACAGRMLALPPGYASPIWPAAGWALAALLLCDFRCWTGVLLGSFAFNCWLQQPAGMDASLLASFLVALGATLQAVLGAWLTKRFLVAAQPLALRGDAFLFLFWGGPVTCLVSASVGVAVLHSLGRLGEQNLFAQWLAWWSGDAIGVLLVAPLVFAVLPRGRVASGLRPAQIVMPLLLAAVLVVMALVWLDRSELMAYHSQPEGVAWQSGISTRAQWLHGGSVLFTFMVVLIVLASQGYAAAIAAEIAERKAVEKALRDSEALLLETGKLANVGGWQLDVPTQKLRWTDGLYRITELSRDVPLARGVSMAFVHPDYHGVMSQAMNDLLGSGKPFDLDLPYLSASGRSGWVHLVGQAEWESGSIVRVHGAVQDITQRIQMEEQANHAQRLHAIGTMAGGIAHDLNNALAPIILLMDMMREQYPDNTEYLDLIESSALHAAEMVKQLLMFAKGAEGKQVLLQPEVLLREMASLVKSTFPKSIHLRLQCEENLPAVMGDSTQLHQVLLNLCVNARDAMPDGGVLTLAANSQPITHLPSQFVLEAKPGRYVVLRVSDTGAGMSPDVIGKIFDPFFTTKGSEKGTGFGLSTVLGIIKSHGGFVQVESVVTQGSTFTVYLPVAAANAGSVDPDNPRVDFVGSGEQVLVVDDELAIRNLAQAVLHQLNVEPVLACDAVEGLQLAAGMKGSLRVVMTDMQMPNMDGLAFVRQLREILPHVPVIVSSGFLEDSVAAELGRLGVHLRMDKPFTRHQMAVALSAALQQSVV